MTSSLANQNAREIFRLRAHPNLVLAACARALVTERPFYPPPTSPSIEAADELPAFAAAGSLSHALSGILGDSRHLSPLALKKHFSLGTMNGNRLLHVYTAYELQSTLLGWSWNFAFKSGRELEGTAGCCPGIYSVLYMHWW